MKPSTNTSSFAPEILSTQVLVVGGGAGGTAAALQAARRGCDTILVSEGVWLGGMLTSAGVCAPDGNELSAFQTGIWGAFLNALREQESQGLDHGWVSFFNYQPKTGANIFAQWVEELSNLKWLRNLSPTEVIREKNHVRGVRFDALEILADVVLDGTELGDLLELGDIPYRLGWEMQELWQEPSAPEKPSKLTETYPVQAPTWVFYLQDAVVAPSESALSFQASPFEEAWRNYGSRKFMGYGGIPHGKYMINWPISGNDYGEGVQRLFGSAAQKQAFFQEAIDHSQQFAQYIIQNADAPYSLAPDVFPESQTIKGGGGAFALHPYYRESRRLVGLQTVIEQNLLPQKNGMVAPLTQNSQGHINSVAIGNYANDHHYPSGDIPLAPKSMIWGGRWTGTSFTMPYECLVPESVDGFLVCEKNQSVSHMANGATRLQPVVLGCGQAAGMAAALCVEQGIEPRQLSVRSLQEALLTDPVAPVAVIPFYNLPPSHPDWQTRQLEILDRPETYPANGSCPDLTPQKIWVSKAERQRLVTYRGSLEPQPQNQYRFIPESSNQVWQVVTLEAQIHEQLLQIASQADESLQVQIQGWPNPAGQWIRVHELSVINASVQ